MFLKRDSRLISLKRMYSMSLIHLDEDKPLSINLELPNVFTVEDAIKFSLEIFNRQNSNLDFILRFELEMEGWML